DGPGHGPAADRRPASGAEGRHAAHLRGHRARPRRARLHGHGRARRRIAGGSPLAVERVVSTYRVVARSFPILLVLAVTALAAGCASTPRGLVPPGTSEPDKFLFDKGTAALN